MSNVEGNKNLATTFAELEHSGGNNNYQTRSKTKSMPDTRLVNTDIYDI